MININLGDSVLLSLQTYPERLITQLYTIKEKLNRGWIEILSLRAALIVFCLNRDFTLKYDSETLKFSLYSNQNIIIRANEKLVIILDLWLDFNRPFVFSNPFESNASICSFYEILRYKSLTALERLDFMNLEARDINISKDQALLHFRTLGLNDVKVYLV